MSKKYMKVIQNMLKIQGKHDLALKLENSYYEYFDGNDGSGYNIGGIKIFVSANYYYELQKLSFYCKNSYPTNSDNLLLFKLLSGLESNKYDYINTVEFMIDTSIEIENFNDIVYIFVDESGNRDFTSKGSKYFMFNFLIKKRPFNLHNVISNYRYFLLEKNLDPLKGNDRRLDIEYFHASKDNKHIRDEIFNLISTFDENSVKAYSYILEKPKVAPNKRKQIDDFYICNLTYAIKKLLDVINIDRNFIIITDTLPLKKDKKNQAKALKSGISEYLDNNKLNLRYDIFHHCSASSVNLQIIDYISWAIFRKYEHNQDEFYKKIEKYCIKIDDVTKERDTEYYAIKK